MRSEVSEVRLETYVPRMGLRAPFYVFYTNINMNNDLRRKYKISRPDSPPDVNLLHLKRILPRIRFEDEFQEALQFNKDGVITSTLNHAEFLRLSLNNLGVTGRLMLLIQSK